MDLMSVTVKYENSDKLCEEYYIDSRGRRQGKSISYYDNGKSIRMVCHYKNDVLDGELIEYYDDGQVKTKCTYKKGVKVGEYTVFFHDGSIKERAYYNDSGLLDGKYLKFYLSGNKWIESRYQSGKLMGIYREWDDDDSGCSLCKIELYDSDGLVDNPIFVVNGGIYTAEQYIEKYNNRDNESFRKAEVLGIKIENKITIFK